MYKISGKGQPPSAKRVLAHGRATFTRAQASNYVLGDRKAVDEESDLLGKYPTVSRRRASLFVAFSAIRGNLLDSLRHKQTRSPARNCGVLPQKIALFIDRFAVSKNVVRSLCTRKCRSPVRQHAFRAWWLPLAANLIH